MNFMERVVYLIVLLNVLFTTAVLLINFCEKSVSDALVVGWFAFTGTELISMAAIVRSAHKHKKKEVEKDEV